MKSRPLSLSAATLAVALSLSSAGCKKSEPESVSAAKPPASPSVRYDHNGLSRVTKRVAELLGKPASTITPEKDLFKDLGADSLDLVELVMALEEDFNIMIDDAPAEKMRT